MITIAVIGTFVPVGFVRPADHDSSGEKHGPETLPVFPCLCVMTVVFRRMVCSLRRT
jgi:hypothetical protein